MTDVAARGEPAARTREGVAARSPETTHLDVSVVLPTLNERRNLEELIPAVRAVLERLGLRHEIVIVDGGSSDGTVAAAQELGARVITQQRRGYGEALRLGLAGARGDHVITMDADLSHDAEVIERLWEARDPMGIAVASRYVPGGGARTSAFRKVLSRILNAVFSRGLSMDASDVSSGFRIYPHAALERLEVEGRDFDVLPEILVRAHAEGWRIREVPFRYQPRRAGSSKARLLRLGTAYLRTFARLWKLRNSIAAADYDERAFDSPIPLQRAWQRRRHEIIMREALSPLGAAVAPLPGGPQPRGDVQVGVGRVLDIGCGSSRILRDLPGAIGVDISFPKLRYMRRYGLPLVHGTIFSLPFRDASFDVIVCSEVIEHIPAGMEPFQEMARVHRPGGTLVLGTPDYATRSWNVFEALYRRLSPGGYADDHITHYTHSTLVPLVTQLGYTYLRTDYVLGSEMILTFRRE